MSKIPAGYIRVSSDEQAQHGISVDAQREILRAWGVVHQAGDVRLYEDAGFSGKNMERPALRQLLADVRAGEISAVVVWKLDRLSRSLRDTLSIIEDELQPAGVALHSVTESIDTGTPAGRMMLNILASFAQLEREQDSDRVVMAHKHLAHDCRYLGGHVAIGYRIDEDRHFQLDPNTAPIVRRVFEMYLSRCGYGEILAYLNAEALQYSKRKSPWGKSDLHYLLSNEMYAGTYIRRLGTDKRSKVTSPEVIRVPGGIPAILTEEEWQRVCAMREANRAQSALYKSETVYPLTGLVRCGICGGLMHLHYGGKSRAGERERYYRCQRSCVPAARLEYLEESVCNSAAFMADQQEAIRRACEIANGYTAAKSEDNLAATRPVRTDLLRVRKRTAQLLDFIGDQGANAPRAMLDELHRLDREEEALKSRLEALTRPVPGYSADRLIHALEACRDIKKSPPPERRALLQEAFRAVQIHPDHIDLVLRCSLCGGDDPPAHILHRLPVPYPFPPTKIRQSLPYRSNDDLLVVRPVTKKEGPAPLSGNHLAGVPS